MQKQETAIEVKVGALILVSLTLLVGFIIVLGDFSLDEGYVLYVDYDNAAGLKPGADVAISGIKAGRVDKIDFMGGQRDPETGREVMVRARLVLTEEMADAVRTNSQFYITTQGVLGEKYIEILTPNLDKPPLPEDSKVRGVDPPRMELLLARGAELLNDISDLLGRDDIPLADLIRNTNNLMLHADETIQENRGSIKSIMGNADTTLADTTVLVGSLKDAVGDGQELKASLHNTRVLTGKLNRRVDPLLDSAQETLDNTQRLTANLDDLVQTSRPKLEATLDNTQRLTLNLQTTTADIQGIVTDIKAGKGSLGGLLQDEEIYDDLKETLRELKRRPWKIIWKE